MNDRPGSNQTPVDELKKRNNLPVLRTENAKLRVIGVKKALGDLQVLRGVSLEAEAARITGIIGPNGAGKSTLLNVVAGLIKPDEGQILWKDHDLTLLSMQQRAQLGMARTFQLSRELGELTVLENLLVAPLDQSGERVINAFLRRPRFWSEERSSAERARQILLKVGLWKLADAPARTLSGGQKKLLELSRALMLKPSAILLDEPAAGVSPPLRLEISKVIQELRAEGMTLVIVEHDMDVVARLCDEVYVLSEGANLTHGSFNDVVSDKRVIGAYLGGIV